MTCEFGMELDHAELREVAGYAAACARTVLEIFERERPQDSRPRVAVETAQSFADGARRTKAMRDAAWAAQKAAYDARVADFRVRAKLRAQHSRQQDRLSSTHCQRPPRSNIFWEPPPMPLERLSCRWPRTQTWEASMLRRCGTLLLLP